MVSYLNISRRLVRWMRRTRLPRTLLRMHYVRLLHCVCCMTGDCSRSNVMRGMQSLLNGWPDQHELNLRLIRAIDDLLASLQLILADRAGAN